VDPWKTRAQNSAYKKRRIPRTTLALPHRVQKETFRKQIQEARSFGQRMGHRLFLTWNVNNPAEFILNQEVAEQRPDPLPKRRGKRLSLAAVALHEGLLRFEKDVSRVWSSSDWMMKTILKERQRVTRGTLRTVAQGLLFQAWARVPWEMRHMVFQAFNDPETNTVDDSWRKACRGSLSVAFVAGAFQSIRVTSRSTAKHLQPRWQVYWPTDEEDRTGKIDLIAVGRLAGLGRIVLCIQVKTGEEPFLEVLLQDPADTRGDLPSQERLRDALWEGVEDFKDNHPEMDKPGVTIYPAIIQTGGAITGVTNVEENTRFLRPLIETMLDTFQEELRDQQRRTKMYRDIDAPGIPIRSHGTR